MAVPKYNEMFMALLCSLKDGKAHTTDDYRRGVSEWCHLSDADLSQTNPNGKGSLFKNRLSWTASYLKGAGLVDSPEYKQLQLTEAGRAIVVNPPEVLDLDFLKQLPEFSEFLLKANGKVDKKGGKPDGQSKTQKSMDREIKKVGLKTQMNGNTNKLLSTQMSDKNLNDLISEFSVLCQQSRSNIEMGLLKYVNQLSSDEFNYLVYDVVRKTSVGTVKTCGDDGTIELVIENVLGQPLLVYVQVQQSVKNGKIGGSAVQSFADAIVGTEGKGMVVTNGVYTEEAREYAAQQNITLIDGRALVGLMFENNIGVSVDNVFTFKSLVKDAGILSPKDEYQASLFENPPRLVAEPELAEEETCDYVPACAAYLRVGLKYLAENNRLSKADIEYLTKKPEDRTLQMAGYPVLCDNPDVIEEYKRIGKGWHYYTFEDCLLRVNGVTYYS